MVNISTGFESGNIGPWFMAEPRVLHFEASRNTGLYAMWFYFRVDGAGPGSFEFVVTNMQECLEPQDWVDERPVYRPVGGEWRRVDLRPQLDLAKNTFRFCINLPDEPVEVAFCYPYTLDDVKVLLDDLAKGEGVEISTPIESEGGRPVPYVRMSCLGNAPNPKTIWAISREHASEVSGGYTLDGFLRALINSPLRQRYEIYAMPVTAIDYVSMGHYGKVVPPADYSLAWFADSPRREVRFIMEQMAKAAQIGRTPRLLIRFHSPSPENDSYLVPINPPVISREQRKRMCRAARLLKEETRLTINEASAAKVTGWSGEDAEASSAVHFATSYGGDSFGMETGYNAMPDGTMGSPQVWRELGAGIARAVERHLLLEDGEQTLDAYGTMPRDMLDNHGWIMWHAPRGCRVECTPTQARFSAWGEKGAASFAIPQKYPVNDVPQIKVDFQPFFDTSYHDGGVVRVLWLMYDARGWRTFAPPLEATLAIGSDQILVTPAIRDSHVAYLRPSFRLSGAFGEFVVRVKDNQ